VKCIVYLCASLTSISACAQQADLHIASPWLYSGALSNKKTEVLAVLANPAAIAKIGNNSCAVFGERKLLLKELDNYQIIYAMPFKNAGVSLRYNFSGRGAFQDHEVAINYGKQLGTGFRLGVDIFNYRQRIEGYSAIQRWGYALGCIAELDDEWTVGFTAQNLFLENRNPWQAPMLYPVLRFGIGFQVSEPLLWELNIEKILDQPVNLVSSFHYLLVPGIFARFGFQTAKSSLTTGASFAFNNFRLDILTSVHPRLGLSPAVALVFTFKEAEE